jgi:hypothetical protein
MQGMIHRLIDVVARSIGGMGCQCPPSEIEGIAVRVHRVMSYQSRQFHTLEHVFGFLDGADDVTSLAAIFHDLIYYQVDDGFPPDVDPLLSPHIAPAEGGFRLLPSAESESYGDCLSVFGFEPGLILKPLGGLNEFLSALAMYKTLDRGIPREGLAAIAACIEASIPFRGLDAKGRGIGEALEQRLRAMASAGRLKADDRAIEAMTHRAVAFANKDVQDFALDDPGRFLSNTWKLLPESNAALRRRGIFSISEYRVALGKMLGFFKSLAPERIFHSYRGLPDPKTAESLHASSRRNLEVAREYIEAKLLAVGLLDAVAGVSGGDAPMALFMGDLPSDSTTCETLADHLKGAEPTLPLDEAAPVYRLLKDGRLDESSFDLKNSPLALTLYERFDPGFRAERWKEAQEYFAGAREASDFLRGFGGDFLEDFLGACASMVSTRAAALNAWLARESTSAGSRRKPAR